MGNSQTGQNEDNKNAVKNSNNWNRDNERKYGSESQRQMDRDKGQKREANRFEDEDIENPPDRATRAQDAELSNEDDDVQV